MRVATRERVTMEAEVLRPGPVVGTGQRALARQTATLATRLSSYASVAAALFHGLSREGVDPERLQGQRLRAHDLAMLIREIEHADVTSLYETSQLVPRRLWSDVRGALDIPEDLDSTLLKLLKQIDEGAFDAAEMAAQADTMKRLAQRLQEAGRGEISAALDDSHEVLTTPSV